MEIINGLFLLLHPIRLLFVTIGVVSGIAIGALPGLSATMGVVLLLPLTFGMVPIHGLLLLVGVYVGAVYGGSISAILIRTPGTPASAATVLDGYEFTKRGEGGRALGIATYASFVGGIISVLGLVVIAPLLARFALKFGAAEYCSLAIFGLTIIGCVSGKTVIRGLIGAVIGLVIATVGIDAMSGYPRFTFNVIQLMNGVSLIPILIGLFALPQVFVSIEDSLTKPQIIQKPSRVIPALKDIKTVTPISIFSGIIGTIIGAIPGTGASIASFVTYNEAKRWSRHPERFGTGIPEGVAAPEAGNNGVTGGTLIPLLTLGVPGDVLTAVLLGAFLVHGLRPGPLLFRDNPEIISGLFVGMAAANVIMLIAGLMGSRGFSRIVSLPRHILTPVIFIMCVIGSYAINNMVFDIGTMILFGIFGYALRKIQIPEAPIIIGIILGPMVESNLRRALILSKGDLSVFVTRPISLFFLIIAVFSLSWPFILKKFNSINKAD